MKCSNCSADMTDWTLDGRLATQITVDVCTPCQAFWFDEHKSLQLAPASTLKLMKFIGEHSSSPKPALSQALRCTRCPAQLTLAHDMIRTMRFTYWQCGNGHGHFIPFFEFLKEKNFIHPLSPPELQQLKLKVQTVNCSSCGAAIDLASNSSCPFCHSPISILDLNQQKQMLAQLQDAAAPRPVDPTLPMKIALAKQQVSSLYQDQSFQAHDDQWWSDARSGDLVQAGLNAVVRWIGNKLV